MEDDELYSGYDDESNPLAGAGAHVLTAAPIPPGTSLAPLGTATATRMRTGQVPPGTTMRMSTGANAAEARPMTSNKGAGYTSSKRAASREGAGPNGRTVSHLKKPDPSMEEQCRDLEKRIHDLIEESATACREGDLRHGLDKAVEAERKDKQVVKMREQHDLQDNINLELSFAVHFNLAFARQVNKMYPEALQVYTALVRDPNYPQASRLRISMGAIYFEQQKYPTAIKMYRMALDKIPRDGHRETWAKVMRNIAMAFVRMGQYQDAMRSFEDVMNEAPDHLTGFNLLLCYFALGSQDKMKQGFLRLVELPVPGVAEAKEDEDEETRMAAVSNDGLHEELRRRQQLAIRTVVAAARLVAPVVDKRGLAAGYDWCIEELQRQALDNPLITRLANDVEMAKAAAFLAQKDVESAIKVLKGFETKELMHKAKAATNLSFLYFLEGDFDTAMQYADMAVTADPYNPRALVNKGCVLFATEEYEGARSTFQHAADIEADCVEAIYNLGLTFRKLEDWADADRTFTRLHRMMPDNVEVIWQLGDIHANMPDSPDGLRKAIQFFKMLNSLLPSDAGVLSRLGSLLERTGDELQAKQCFQESHSTFSVSMDVISWLGAHHVRDELYEKAMPYFDLASKIQPSDARWSLMVASCLRRVGLYPAALAKYREVHARFPDNIECLKYMIHICTELGYKDEIENYANALRRLQQSAETRQAATSAAPAMPVGHQMSPPSAMQPSGETPAEPGRGLLEISGDLVTPDTAAPARKAQVVYRSKGKDDDDWGDGELGEDLLPM